MHLSTLLLASGYPEALSRIKQDVTVREITCDSRTVKKGSLFVAIRGLHADSHLHIADAASRGASAAICEYPTGAPIPEIRLPDTRRAFARLSDAFCGHPTKGMHLVGVTGTNGKTSIASILSHILSESGMRTGTIGTVGASIDGNPLARDTSDTMTTPDPQIFYPLLANMKREGCNTVVLEATSHASALGKLDPVRFDLLIFTNLTRDHLDFHGSFEAYFAAKADLFRKTERALVNLDGSAAHGDGEGYAARIIEIAQKSGAEVRTCSADIRKSPDFLLADFQQSLHGGIGFTVKTKDGSPDIPVRSRLLGIYSGMNLLESAAAARMLGISPACISAALETFPGVPGRMEQVLFGKEADISVYIDFAHTPDALENLLRAVQAFRGKQNRIVVLFGCGGDRDPTKRKDMGIIASRMADFVYITSDNSRSEDPNNIIKDILKGIDKEKPYRVIPSRAEAIEAAILQANAGDIILLCGKGHERYTVDRTGMHPFCESDIAKAAFQKRCFKKS